MMLEREREGSIMMSSAAVRCCVGLRREDIELRRLGRGLSGFDGEEELGGWFSCASEKLRFLLDDG